MASEALQRYQRLLDTSDLEEYKERVISHMLGELRAVEATARPPIRLAKIAQRFQIIPTPRFIFGKHDGEITFEREAGAFVIKICKSEEKGDNGTAQERDNHARRRRRNRFTYAHEMAHRFFFVQDQQEWKRASNLATANLSPAEQIRERMNLHRREEELCDQIARRVLVPEELLERYCPLEKWFASGKHFFGNVSRTAERFDISRDCLLVRLQRQAKTLANDRHCVFVVERSKLERDRHPDRDYYLACGIFPKGSTGLRNLYPRCEWAKAGDEAHSFVVERLFKGRPSSGEVEMPLASGAHDGSKLYLRGWWTLIGVNRIALWGSLV